MANTKCLKGYQVKTWCKFKPIFHDGHRALSDAEWI